MPITIIPAHNIKIIKISGIKYSLLKFNYIHFIYLNSFTYEHIYQQKLHDILTQLLYIILGIILYFNFATTISTYFWQISSLSASTMTRITGSVPDSRTSIRPVSPSSAVTWSIAA